LHYKAEMNRYICKIFFAATLSSSVGIYGPVLNTAFVNQWLQEKKNISILRNTNIIIGIGRFKIKLTTLITRINTIRNEQASLQQTNNIVFCDTNNEQVMAYYKYDDDTRKRNINGRKFRCLMINKCKRWLDCQPLDLITGNQPLKVEKI
jgi:hypothetical protein